MIVVIDQSGTEVTADRHQPSIKRSGIRAEKYPLRMIDQLVVQANVMLDASTLRKLSEQGVQCVFLPSRGKGEAAFLAAGMNTRAPLRLRQYRAALDSQAQLVMVRWNLEQKFEAYANMADIMDDLSEKKDPAMSAVQPKIVSALAALPQQETIDQLRGVEGALARQWFEQLSRALPKQWEFSGRNRQPPKDPVNALLSLGYTLLYSEVRQILAAEGFDPAQGYLHQHDSGREALVLDMMELFRVYVDCWMLRLLQDLSPEGFSQSSNDGCRLKKDSRQIVYGAWAELREDLGLLGSEGVALAERIRGRASALARVMQDAVDATG